MLQSNLGLNHPWPNEEICFAERRFSTEQRRAWRSSAICLNAQPSVTGQRFKALRRSHQKAPASIRTVVALAEDTSLETLSRLADPVAGAEAQRRYVAAVSGAPSRLRAVTKTTEWQKEILRLVQQM